jgi:hypothetical protein
MLSITIDVNWQVQVNFNNLSGSIVSDRVGLDVTLVLNCIRDKHFYTFVLVIMFFVITFNYISFLFYLSAENGLNIMLMSDYIYMHVSYVAFV